MNRNAVFLCIYVCACFKQIWDKMFVPLHCLNFGIGSDQTQNVLWRVQNGELDNFSPKASCHNCFYSLVLPVSTVRCVIRCFSGKTICCPLLQQIHTGIISILYMMSPLNLLVVFINLLARSGEDQAESVTTTDANPM